MTFIDWSDPEAMLGLLVEWVADERDAAADPARVAFLAQLAAELSALAVRHDDLSLDELVAEMQALHEARAAGISGDPALGHLADCIAEIERVRSEGGSA